MIGKVKMLLLLPEFDIQIQSKLTRYAKLEKLNTILHTDLQTVLKNDLHKRLKTIFFEHVLIELRVAENMQELINVVKFCT